MGSTVIQAAFDFSKSAGDIFQFVFDFGAFVVPAPEFTGDQKYRQKDNNVNNQYRHWSVSFYVWFDSVINIVCRKRDFKAHMFFWHTLRHTWCVIVAHIARIIPGITLKFQFGTPFATGDGAVQITKTVPQKTEH